MLKKKKFSSLVGENQSVCFFFRIGSSVSFLIPIDVTMDASIRCRFSLSLHFFFFIEIKLMVKEQKKIKIFISQKIIFQ